MLRVFIGGIARTSSYFIQKNIPSAINHTFIKNVARPKYYSNFPVGNFDSNDSLLKNPKIIQITNNIQTRSLIKFSWGKGKRKTVKPVLQRFYRLNWGIWIRTKCGKNKKLWKKTAARKTRIRQHVFCNAQQSRMLDTMVNNYWRKPKYYVEDPYEPYHTREDFMFSRKQPKPYLPN